jgi:hypothetical protein
VEVEHSNILIKHVNLLSSFSSELCALDISGVPDVAVRTFPDDVLINESPEHDWHAACVEGTFKKLLSIKEKKKRVFRVVMRSIDCNCRYL